MLPKNKKYQLDPNYFTFLFLGNIGPVAGVQHLIESFILADLKRSQLVIIGEGTEKNRCISLAQSCGNIRFLADPDIANVPWLQSLADVCLLPVRRGAALSSIPSKLSPYMLSAKPIIASVDAESDSAHIIRSSNCGWVIEPEQQSELSAKMREVEQADPSELSNRGERGRAYALEHLSKNRG